nr:hypothetical protein [Allomuricauda sp.]
MFKNVYLAALFILLFSCEGTGQSRVQVVIPSAETESEYIWNTLQDITFFEENQYQVSLPKGTFIDTLISKSKKGTLTNKDHAQLQLFVKDSVYNKSDYLKGYEKAQKEIPLVHNMLQTINQEQYNWVFTEFDTYRITLTLYGPGGSYNPDEGSVLLFTTSEGKFKNYQNPANTIIHELVHIGVEKPIIQKYQVPHTLKERIVDTFVFLNFKGDLPEYRIQDMGEKRIDPYLRTKEDLHKLDQHVKRIMQGQHPKE